MNKATNQECHKEPVQVYCRLRPMQNENEIACLKMVSPSIVQMSIPEAAGNVRECLKDTLYTFSYVFDQTTLQKDVFKRVALPLVDSLLHGRNGLLFTYGITGSGKTYTMTGTPQNNGVMPRALDVIFNSILGFQAKKFIFKPDRLNGFEVQSEVDAKRDGLMEIQSQNQILKTPRVFRRQDNDWGNRAAEETKIEDIKMDNMFAVFVTYVEIYNNYVYDLLEENFEENTGSKQRPQNKVVREDGAKNMYVHGATEIEVKSTDEAFEMFNRGMRRKRMAHNSLNAESSRSHSVFTVRLVQAPLDMYGETILQDVKSISISQLSFVDLAGSERSNRTKNSGERLREAGNINNSLMNLRTCLDILRENQLNGTNKLVPYRSSKVTHLLKNFFEGESNVKMIVCVNPRYDDCDENLHVLKFAEVSQEVQVTKPTPLRNIDNLLPGRRKANQIFKHAMASLNDLASNTENLPVHTGVPAVYSLASQFPDLILNAPEDDRLLLNLMIFLEVEIAKRKKIEEDAKLKGNEFRELLIENGKELLMAQHQISILSTDLSQYKEKMAGLESQLKKTEMDSRKQISGCERVIKRLQDELQEKEEALNRRLQERERDKQRYQSRIVQTAEKMSHQMEVKLTDQKRKLEMEMRQKDKKLQQVKRILSDEMLASTSSVFTPLSSDIRATASSESLSTPIPSTITTRRKQINFNTPASCNRQAAPAVSNPRHRRSRSVSDDRWLEHRPQAPVPLNTVMQPVLKKRKSITKLTDMKDIANSKTSKYCLLTQEQDSEGDLETHIYKGDVVPTCGGGAQVILNDVEILKQKSPSSSPTRKRSGNGVSQNMEDKCSVSIEGHGKKSRHHL